VTRRLAWLFRAGKLRGSEGHTEEPNTPMAGTARSYQHRVAVEFGDPVRVVVGGVRAALSMFSTSLGVEERGSEGECAGSVD
jgi:hypothetical protein